MSSQRIQPVDCPSVRGWGPKFFNGACPTGKWCAANASKMPCCGRSFRRNGPSCLEISCWSMFFWKGNQCVDDSEYWICTRIHTNSLSLRFLPIKMGNFASFFLGGWGGPLSHMSFWLESFLTGLSMCQYFPGSRFSAGVHWSFATQCLRAVSVQIVVCL